MITRELRGGPLMAPTPGVEVMRELGTLAVTLILDRTRAGRDAEGMAFAPLSAGYAKAKAQAGLTPVADLTVSGGMLEGMRVTAVDDLSATIGFVSQGGGAARGATFIQRSRAVGAAEKAGFHCVDGAGRSKVKRDFFGLTDAEADALQAAAQRALEGAWE
jgi:hypothetical protein